MLNVHAATTGVADGTSSDLPAYRLRRVSQYIQEHLQRELRLAELSALVHMSPYHFARLFKRSTGVPPHRFLVRCRIDEARALLAARTAPIAEISRMVGFRTPSHFTTTFRRITGMTPSVYRSGGRAGSPYYPSRARGRDVRNGSELSGQEAREQQEQHDRRDQDVGDVTLTSEGEG